MSTKCKFKITVKSNDEEMLDRIVKRLKARWDTFERFTARFELHCLEIAAELNLNVEFDPDEVISANFREKWL